MSQSEVEGQSAQQHDSSSLQATMSGRCHSLLTEPSSGQDDQPCSSGMLTNSQQLPQYCRRRLLTEPSNGHGNCFEDDQPCSSGMHPNTSVQWLPQHQISRETDPGIYI